jgi:hypothetical protein
MDNVRQSGNGPKEAVFQGRFMSVCVRFRQDTFALFEIANSLLPFRQRKHP